MRLILAALLAFALPAAAQEMTDAEREAFRAEVRAYLLENPEVIMEAVGILEARENEARVNADVQMARANQDALFNDPTSFVGGNPNGDITIVEFMDYRCGFCKRAFPEVKALLENDGNIRHIVKEFPILGEQSILASRFALAVRKVAGDDAYEIAHDALMELRGDVNEATLTRLSDSMFLDTPTVFAAMNDPEIGEIINANRALAQRLQITGTPTFVFEDQMLRGYVPLDQMTQIIGSLRG